MTLFPPQPPVLAAIQGTSTQFPIHRIFCIGRNYAAHAAEMGFTVDKETDPPFYFIKDASTYVPSGATIAYPPMTHDYHYEVELALALDGAGHHMTPEEAEASIYGYMCALDMTRRDIQGTARDAGRPWDFSKNFEESCVLSPIVPKDQVGSVDSLDLHLEVNGETKQASNTANLIWSVTEIICDLSRYYHLQPGDIILTGTPSGIGPVVAGDVITAGVQHVGDLTLTIAK